MNQTPVNIQPRPQQTEELETTPRLSAATPRPQGCSTTNSRPGVTDKIPNAKSWINDFDSNGKCSKDIVVEWMLVGDNWSKFSGCESQKPGEAESQTGMAKKLAQILVNRGHRERTTKSIIETIRYLKKSFTATYKTVTATGYGVDPAVDGNVTVEEKTTHLFKWYYDLLPLLGSDPLVTGEGMQSNGNIVSGTPDLSAYDEQPDYEDDFHSTNMDDVDDVNLDDDDDDDDDDVLPLSSTRPPSPRQSRGKKRSLNECITDFFDRQRKASKKYEDREDELLEFQREKRDDERVAMIFERQKQWLLLNKELRNEEKGSEGYETIKKFMEDLADY